MNAGRSEIVVTHHAAERYCQRVNPALSLVEAVEAILAHSRVIGIAADFGCKTVKTCTGARLILSERTVITVLGRHPYLPAARRRND